MESKQSQYSLSASWTRARVSIEKFPEMHVGKLHCGFLEINL